ncbi:MAG: hypothetical protein QM674_19785 [Burkholderiaceae bacterium]
MSVVRARTASLPPARIATGAAIAAFAVAAALGAMSAARAQSDTSSASQAQHLLDRERCNDPASYQDKDACLREAAAARAASARGGDANGSPAADPAEYRRNEARRCDPLPPALRDDCLARVGGAGIGAGSVGEGGILRESITREIGPQPPIVPVEIP